MMANKADNKRGQAVFEYFILSIIVISIALGFLRNRNYVQIKGVSEEVFNQAVANITK
jgi:hypothetical protein